MGRSKSKKLAKAKADKYFAEYIRKRDWGKKCITCGRFDRPLTCGHFISRRYEAVRYNEQNAHGQCEKCNSHEHGNQFEHSVKIDEMYGAGTAEKLRQLSLWKSGPRSQYDYEEIAEEYRKKIRNT